MIRVEVSRNEVAAGDQGPLRAEWEFPDDVTIGRVIVHTVESHFLASVAGDVAWKLSHEGGADLALLHVDDGAPPARQVSSLFGHFGLRYPLARLRTADGVHRLNWVYLSGGRAMEWDEFTAWVAPPSDQSGVPSGSYRIDDVPPRPAP